MNALGVSRRLRRGADADAPSVGALGGAGGGLSGVRCCGRRGVRVVCA